MDTQEIEYELRHLDDWVLLPPEIQNYFIVQVKIFVTKDTVRERFRGFMEGLFMPKDLRELFDK